MARPRVTPPGIVSLAVLSLEQGARVMTRVAVGHVDDEHIGPDPARDRAGH